MILRRLTKEEKIEILECFRAGDSVIEISKQYNCTSNTINRTVKSLISQDEYILLKEKRVEINKAKNSLNIAKISRKVKDEKFIGLSSSKSITSSQLDNIEVQDPINKNKEIIIQNLKNDESKELDESEKCAIETNEENLEDENNFEELVPLFPLVSSYDFETEKQKVDYQILDKKSLPEIVYMLVDKKVELDSQLISDLPEWDFLPENEKMRKAILLFPNQRSAKRNCSRSQRVIKIPNTSVFELTKTYLITRGITRLILEDIIIGLDK